MTSFSVIFYIVWVEDTPCSISPISGPTPDAGYIPLLLELSTYILPYVKGKT